MSRYSIIIDRDSLQFTASHWIKYRPAIIDTMPDGSISIRREQLMVTEPLHEHTFRAKLEITGELDELGCVIDFVLAEQVLIQILQQFEQKVLIPKDAPDLEMRQDGSQLIIWVSSHVWVFLEKDTKWLPVKNASTEAIASIILADFVAVLQKNNILPEPFSDEQFVLTLEEDSGMYARVAFRGKK